MREKELKLSKFQAGVKVKKTRVDGSADGRRYVTGGTRKKVAIVGFGQPDCFCAPFNDPEWEIWGINMGNRLDLMKDRHGDFRADRWFDLHELIAQSKQDMEWIKTCPVPLYLTEEFKDNPNAVVFPLADVVTAHQEFGPLYFASSFAYMVGLAMLEGFKTIGFFGCDLDWGRERVVENGNLQFWIGLARGRGVKVVMSPKSTLLSHPALYGFEYWKERNAVEERCAKLVFELTSSPKVFERYVHMKSWIKSLTNQSLQRLDDM